MRERDHLERPGAAEGDSETKERWHLIILLVLVILISGDCVQVQPKRRSWSNKCQQTKDSYGGTSSLYEHHDWKHLQNQICLNCFQPHGRAEGESETRDRFCEIETTAFILWTLQRNWHRRRAIWPGTARRRAEGQMQRGQGQTSRWASSLVGSPVPLSLASTNKGAGVPGLNFKFL